MSGKTIKIELDWSDEMGECYDCGLPAAYRVESDHPNLQGHVALRCSICAAWDASHGETITYLYEDKYS